MPLGPPDRADPLSGTWGPGECGCMCVCACVYEYVELYIYILIPFHTISHPNNALYPYKTLSTPYKYTYKALARNCAGEGPLSAEWMVPKALWLKQVCVCMCVCV